MAEKEKYEEAMKKGNYALALTQLDQAISQNPNDPNLFFNFAICCFFTKNFAKTESVLRSLLEQFPGYIEVNRVYRLLVFSLIEEKKWKEAEELIRARLELNRTDLHLLSFLAHIYEYTHRIPAAIEVHRNVLTIDPNFKNSLNSLGYLIAIQKERTPEEVREAVSCLKKALELDPENPAYLDSFGTLLYQLGKEEDALKAVRKGLQRDPSNSFLLERLKSFS